MSPKALALVMLALLVGWPSSSLAFTHLKNASCYPGETRVRLPAGVWSMQPKCGQFPSSGGSRDDFEYAAIHWYWPGFTSSTNTYFSLSTSCTGASAYGWPWDARNVAQYDGSEPSTVHGYAEARFACVAGDSTFTEIDLYQNSSTGTTTTCAAGAITRRGTWVHEMGHAYGWAHFDSWLSTMNTITPDITSCRADHSVRPSSDAQQGQAMWYGWPADVDVGSTPVEQTGSLIGGAGWEVQDDFVMISGSQTFISHPVTFTHMNMRDAWPSSSIKVAFYLSTNRTLDASDTRLNSVYLNDTFAGAIYPYTVNVYIYPQTQLPLYQRRWILVVSDPDNDHSEYDEGDNVTDTKVSFIRFP